MVTVERVDLIRAPLAQVALAARRVLHRKGYLVTSRSKPGHFTSVVGKAEGRTFLVHLLHASRGDTTYLTVRSSAHVDDPSARSLLQRDIELTLMRITIHAVEAMARVL